MAATGDVGRRQALGLIGGGAAIAATGTPAMAKGASAPLDFDRAADRLRAFMLMRGALDDRLVIGCVSGHYHAVIDDALTPLFGVVSATFTRYRPRGNGGFDAAALEVGCFTDPITGVVMKEWRNPFSGDMVAVPAGGYPPSAFIVRPDMTLKFGSQPPGVAIEQSVLPLQVQGDDVWITEMTRSTGAPPPGGGKPSHYSETVAMHARRQDLEAIGAKRVRCETAFTNVVSWRPWMKMGDRPGYLMAVGSGLYGATLETLPPAWLAAARTSRPELLADPAAVLDPVWKAL